MTVSGKIRHVWKCACLSIKGWLSMRPVCHNQTFEPWTALGKRILVWLARLIRLLYRETRHNAAYTLEVRLSEELLKATQHQDDCRTNEYLCTYFNNYRFRGYCLVFHRFGDKVDNENTCNCRKNIFCYSSIFAVTSNFEYKLGEITNIIPTSNIDYSYTYRHLLPDLKLQL